MSEETKKATDILDDDEEITLDDVEPTKPSAVNAPPTTTASDPSEDIDFDMEAVVESAAKNVEGGFKQKIMPEGDFIGEVLGFGYKVTPNGKELYELTFTAEGDDAVYQKAYWYKASAMGVQLMMADLMVLCPQADTKDKLKSLLKRENAKKYLSGVRFRGHAKVEDYNEEFRNKFYVNGLID